MCIRDSLCTEVYLDRFFENQAALMADLQRAADSFAGQYPDDQIGDYDEDLSLIHI